MNEIDDDFRNTYVSHALINARMEDIKIYVCLLYLIKDRVKKRA